MIESIWILEIRTRERRNSKWSEWKSMVPRGSSVTAYQEYPADQIVDEDKYQRRAVEFVRKTDNHDSGPQ